MSPGPMQILIIIILVLIIFGAGRVPSIMENLAKGINSFKKGLKEEDSSENGNSAKPPMIENEGDNDLTVIEDRSEAKHKQSKASKDKEKSGAKD